MLEVKPDMNEHTVTVTFEDVKTSAEKIKDALVRAGFAVPEPASEEFPRDKPSPP